ncbi:hypothetical protein IFM89_006200 [Coptis chinensis]|uniref:Uncharacterized protein n=1 Tax=Coptis chinensis TaxID=261450 RepID=A0A835HAW5_9MAGN|nr:hypothetical protein IFM89_006200 [Coptis chinensis]
MENSAQENSLVLNGIHDCLDCRRKNASTGERVKLNHDKPQEGPTNVKGPNQLHSQGEYIQGVDKISQHSDHIQVRSQEKSTQVDAQSSQRSGVTIVEYDVNVNHLLSLLRQHIESEFSRFTGNYLPVTLEVDGRTFPVNIAVDNVGNPNVDLNDVYIENDLLRSRHAFTDEIHSTDIATTTATLDNNIFSSDGIRSKRTSLRSYHNSARGFEDNPYIEPF